MYVVGTFGEPILIRTGVDLTGATAVNLNLTRPDASVVQRDLGISSITNPTLGEVTYVPTQADLTIAGTYTFSVTVPMGPTKQVVAQGTLTMAPAAQSTGLLVVEDGTGLENANSYCSVADGNTYHYGHLYADQWTSKPIEQKERALVMATRSVDYNMQWNGYRANQYQSLGWPRACVIDYDAWAGYTVGIGVALINFGPYIPSNVVPQRVKDATCEMARQLLISDRTQEDSSMGLHALGIGAGAITMSFDPSDRRQVLTDVIRSYLEPYGTVRGRKRGFSNVVRVQ
jgi:hypothetical protein